MLVEGEISVSVFSVITCSNAENLNKKRGALGCSVSSGSNLKMECVFSVVYWPW